MRKFRLPLKEVRDELDLFILENTLEQYTDWYFQNEEGMTSRQADKAWQDRIELEEYIKTRRAVE